MALVLIRIGSAEDIYQYDDGSYDSAIETSASIKAGTPVDPTDVIRLEDMEGRLLSPVATTNIANPTELNSVTGILGALVFVYKITGGAVLNDYTLYAYDASGPAVNAPYIMDASGAGNERWIAVAGKYSNGVDMSVHVTNANAHHSQIHSAFSHSDISSSGVNIDDAVTKRHTQGTDTSLGSLSVYANNAAATAGGLSVGDLYRTGADPDTVCIVH